MIVTNHHNSNPLLFSNLLHISQLVKNLISIRNLCLDNNTLVEFFPDSFSLKDLTRGTSTLAGGIENGLYKLPKNLPSLLESISI